MDVATASNVVTHPFVFDARDLDLETVDMESKDALSYDALLARVNAFLEPYDVPTDPRAFRERTTMHKQVRTLKLSVLEDACRYIACHVNDTGIRLHRSLWINNVHVRPRLMMDPSTLKPCAFRNITPGIDCSGAAMERIVHEYREQHAHEVLQRVARATPSVVCLKHNTTKTCMFCKEEPTQIDFDFKRGNESCSALTNCCYVMQGNVDDETPPQYVLDAAKVEQELLQNQRAARGGLTLRLAHMNCLQTHGGSR